MTKPKLDRADMGWMAAVIDLKGKIYEKQNKQRLTPQLVLHVSSKDQRIVERLSKMTGTKPAMRDQREPAEFMRHPCGAHCPEAHQHVTKFDMPDSGVWTVTGLAMAIVLWNLRPFMASSYQYTERIEQVLRNTKLNGKGCGSVRTSVQRLIDLGWPLPPHIREAYYGGVSRTAA